MKNDLSPKMQERLEKWMKNPTPSKDSGVSKIRNYIGRPVRRDWGDDIRDFEEKEQSRVTRSNLMYPSKFT